MFHRDDVPAASRESKKEVKEVIDQHDNACYAFLPILTEASSSIFDVLKVKTSSITTCSLRSTRPCTWFLPPQNDWVRFYGLWRISSRDPSMRMAYSRL